MAGALAGATSTLILYPLDVVRSRQTVQAVPKYKNLVHALHSIATEEGAGALYKGEPVCACVWSPLLGFCALQIVQIAREQVSPCQSPRP